MSDVIGRGIIEVQADASGVSAGMEAAKRSVEQFENAAVAAGANAGAALDRAGNSGGGAADKMDAATRRFINSIEREIAAVSLSRDQYRQWEAQVKGISETVYGPLVARLREAKTAQEAAAQASVAQAAADREAAQAKAAAAREEERARSARESMLASLRDQAATMGRTTEEVLRYKAAQAGIAAEAEPLIRQIQEIKATQEAAARATAEQARADREAAAAARERANAQREAQQAQERFLNGLREQVFLQGQQGRAPEDTLRARASNLGVGDQAAPLILQLQNQRAAQEAAAKAARDEAEAQREAARAKSGRDDFIRSLNEQVQAIGRTRAELLELRAAQLGVTQQAAPMIARLKEAEQNYRGNALSAKEMALALRGVPAQLTDIVVSLQGGQAPLTVLLQQGGQLRDMFGSVTLAAQALGGAVLKLLTNPVVLAAAAVVGLAAAYNKGSKEADAYNRAIILTGNASGTTRDALAGMAAEIDRSIGTQAQAAEALAALASTGRVAAGNLEAFATTAIRSQRATGQAVSETAKIFADLGKEPVEASRRLNEETGYLTLAVYEQIKALQEAGRATEAAALAQRTYADEIDRRSGAIVSNLGAIERAWKAIKDRTLEAVDAALNVGRTQSSAQQIADLQAEQQFRGGGFAARLRGRDRVTPAAGLSDQEIKDQIDLLQAGQREASRFAALQAENVAIQKAGIAAEGEVDKIRKASLSKAQQLNAELKKYRENVEAIRRANPDSNLLDPKRIAQDEANIRDRFKETGRQPKAYQDDAATRTLQQLRQQEAALREQLDTEGKIGAAQRARAEFEALIADLKEKKTLTADQKSLLANQAAILTQLRKNELIEDEVKLTQDAAKAREKAERERLQFIERARQIDETIAQQRQSRQEQYDRAFGTLGQGSQRRQQVEEQRAIYREAERLQAQLVKSTPVGLLGSDEYVQASMRIKAALDQALADQEAYYKRLREAQQDWSIGASEALNDYLDNVRDVSKQVQETFSRAFSGLEDALTNALDTGSLNLDSVGKQIASDINRSIVRQNITGPLADWLKGSLTGAAGSGNGGGFVGDVLGSLFGNSVFGLGGAGAGLGGGNRLPLDPTANALRVTVVAGLQQLANGGAGGLVQSLGGVISSGFSSLFGGGGFSAFDPTGYGITSGVSSLVSLGLGGGRAAGGPVYANTLHEVVEDGPELLHWRNRQYLLAGEDGGRVEPLRQGAGSRGQTVIQTINVMPGANRRTSQQAAAAAARELALSNARNN